MRVYFVFCSRKENMYDVMLHIVDQEEEEEEKVSRVFFRVK